MAEHNLIQNPELLRRLATKLGLRQPHIVPALNEGVQAVVVMADLSRPPFASDVHSFHGWDGTTGNGMTAFATVFLTNPLGSNINIRVRRYSLDSSGTVPAGTQWEVEAGHTFVTPAGLGDPTQLESSDARQSYKPVAKMSASQQGEIAVITRDWIIDASQQPFTQEPFNLIIPPNRSFVWQNFTSPTQALRVNVEWDEEPIDSAL